MGLEEAKGSNANPPFMEAHDEDNLEVGDCPYGSPGAMNWGLRGHIWEGAWVPKLPHPGTLSLVRVNWLHTKAMNL